MILYSYIYNVGEYSMKKLLISLVLLIPFVTGCTDIDTRININPDKTASVVSSVTYQGNLSNKNDATANLITENYVKLLDKYYKVNSTSSNKLSTITATKKISNVEREDLDLSSLGFKTNLPSGKFIDTKKNFLVKSYNVDMVFNYEDMKEKLGVPEVKLVKADDKKSGIDPKYYHKYMDREDVAPDEVEKAEYDMAANLDESAKQLASENSAPDKDESKKTVSDENNISFSVQLPAFASYNNADNVSDNVYTWIIKTDEPTVIKLQYVQYSGWAFSVIILIGMLLLIYIARRIIRRDSTKRIDNIENIV